MTNSTPTPTATISTVTKNYCCTRFNYEGEALNKVKLTGTNFNIKKLESANSMWVVDYDNINGKKQPTFYCNTEPKEC